MVDYAKTNETNQPSIKWAQNYLQTNGYVISGLPELIRAMPWSTITHFSTSKGSIYLKEMASLFSVEPTLIKTLSQWDSDALPKVVGINDSLSCFLMEDAGIPLSKYLKFEVQIEILAKALRICANSQLKAASHIDALLTIGVPDWRLSNLPDLYRHLISQEGILKADGLTSVEMKALDVLNPRVLSLCNDLSRHRIPETLEHTDFHGNNILIKDDRLTIGDWGDAVISHPFFSLVSYLNSATRYHGLKEGDARYTDLQNVYLDNWIAFEPKDQLLEAFQLAKRLRPLQITLSFIRVKMCSNLKSSFNFTGYISEALREFIKAEEIL